MIVDAQTVGHRLCIAPMMGWSHRHARVFWRQLTLHAGLYTEMVTTGAILHGPREHLLAHDEIERPLALQLGGADPAALARCAAIAAEAGFDEINLNVGCPSERVQKGAFGAALMRHPEVVAAAVTAMAGASPLPVTVKTRLGVDEQDSYDALRDFVGCLVEAGLGCLALHARKAILGGLSAKENREIPPLRYDYAYRIKQDFPELEVIVNGGIGDLEAADAHLARVDGVMLGRAAYQDPYVLAEVDRRFFAAAAPVVGRRAAVEAYLPYMKRELGRGAPFTALLGPLFGLYKGRRGGRIWRRQLNEAVGRGGAGADAILRALETVEAHSPREAEIAESIALV